MYDIKWIKSNAKLFDDGMKKRGLTSGASAPLLALYREYEDIEADLKEMQKRRSLLAKKLETAQKSGGDTIPLLHEINALKRAVIEREAMTSDLMATLDEMIMMLPNYPAADVPKGKTAKENAQLRMVGKKKTFTFAPKRHAALGEAMGLMDFEQAAVIAGTHFVVLRGALAQFERALSQFMMDNHVKNYGYTEMSLPHLVNDETLYRAAQIPHYADNFYRVDYDYWLLPSPEVSLLNAFTDRIFTSDELPIRMVTFAPCFRAEDPVAGKEGHSLFWLHQFYKVVQVNLVTPAKAEKELADLLAASEDVLKKLGLTYRVVMLCAGKLSFCSHKTYGLEVWSPGQQDYIEVSRLSTSGDFHSRRTNVYLKNKNSKSVEPIHIIGGSGFAIGRLMGILMENYQNKDGSVDIPAILQPYMNGLKKIKKEG